MQLGSKATHTHTHTSTLPMRAAAGQGSAARGAVPKPHESRAHSHREKLEARFAFLRVGFQLPKTFTFTYLGMSGGHVANHMFSIRLRRRHTRRAFLPLLPRNGLIGTGRNGPVDLQVRLRPPNAAPLPYQFCISRKACLTHRSVTLSIGWLCVFLSHI